ncbi:hypothetical protein H6G97_40410 [Nostoc flagelliforme FACHB-838]|uniref:Uncharacterized protein n=1 Tax=Nostoc flagelliforme FACHB-838 TaxID=2692904 RepID=A0ABR8E1H3_9NOSO|nr:hypothetical protein [Nostoc flagelliforme]MBD2535328.1 hypothetical protein [Nostoc flagelliforme FACHB-838]
MMCSNSLYNIDLNLVKDKMMWNLRLTEVGVCSKHRADSMMNYSDASRECVVDKPIRDFGVRCCTLFNYELRTNQPTNQQILA